MVRALRNDGRSPGLDTSGMVAAAGRCGFDGMFSRACMRRSSEHPDSRHGRRSAAQGKRQADDDAKQDRPGSHGRKFTPA
jgi:hypothetical protein